MSGESSTNSPAVVGARKKSGLLQADTADQILLIDAARGVLSNEEFAESPFGPFSITHVKRLAEALGQLKERRLAAVLLDLGPPVDPGPQTPGAADHPGHPVTRGY